VSIGLSAKASKQTEKLRKSQIGSLKNQRAATDVMRMQTEDLAGQGGLSAGQYNRQLMQNDVFATQAEGMVNKIESQSVFGDAFRNQAYAKLALSEVGSYTKKTAQGLQDLDAEMSIRNAGLAMEGASRLAKTEADILAQETAFQEAEIARKTKIAENISKGIASTASLIGADVKYAKMGDGVNAGNISDSGDIGFNQTLDTPQTLQGIDPITGLDTVQNTQLQGASGNFGGIPTEQRSLASGFGLPALDQNLINMRNGVDSGGLPMNNNSYDSFA
jgi:hypothetical protein